MKYRNALTLMFVGVVQLVHGQMQCRQACNLLQLGVHPDDEAALHCSPTKDMEPYPFAFDFCSAVFMKTFSTSCRSICEGKSPPMEDCNKRTAEVRAASGGGYYKNVLAACDSGNEGAVAKMMSMWEEFASEQNLPETETVAKVPEAEVPESRRAVPETRTRGIRETQELGEVDVNEEVEINEGEFAEEM
mmetsp:Transcript_21816/g.31660  ORF Transcript_21816/g.31660 Transcript_21816/m.31660 type:complete len:190 (-) Transcript_21816:87-656(-)|eukprot:CAMPEP_0113943162 /NCGR_PEP_ID=MMETSP1339-20121228/19366_1 /TAXON_ID=94617 /ORGANISM="Fibrocapsa japonica" /LENGTH=189 /DNA_ID=CAMNT_0000947955 /DNA_START=164 /DNA_END=733 /DNA_ORIENTATION=+ /assembly_acc=CAM_ASM_000762